MIISFAWTTPALLAGAKTVTRRDWDDDYARKFKPGTVHQAWDKSPRTGKGTHVADIEIVSVEKKWSSELTASDWLDEGFEHLKRNRAVLALMGVMATPDEIWDGWKKHPCQLWVVRFKLVRLR